MQRLIVDFITATQYTDQMLYTQLLQYASLFDVQKVMKAMDNHPRKGTPFSPALPRDHAFTNLGLLGEILDILNANADLLGYLAATVDSHLVRNGRRFVKLNDLFSFMSV